MKKSLLSLLVLVFAFSSFAIAQQRTITGQVVAADNGDPLPNVTVLLKGTTRGTATDLDGNYSLQVPPEAGTLVFSSIGFQTREINIGDQNVINVELSTDVAQLSDVVVVGFGSQSRRKITSSVSTVSSDQLENVQLNTFENALQGAATGVQVTQAGGILGSPVAVRIRGTASINASSQPLYVIDGVPITQNGGAIGRNVSGTNNFGTNPLINLNPEDIASIQVLKDAAASAIYGSRGANGVVLITTKSGRPGQAQVNIGYSAGYTEATDRYNMLNGEQWTQIWNDAVVNRFGESVAPLTGLLLPTEDIQSTDWMNLVQHQGFLQEVNASVSGGSDETQYYVSGSFSDEEGYITGNQLDRYSARVKVSHDISDQVRIGLNISPSLSRNFKRSERNQVDAPITYAALYYPNVEARNEDGSPSLGISPNPIPVFPGTPLSNLEGTEITETFQQTIISSNVEWNIMPELSFNTDFTIDLFDLQTVEKRSDITTDGFGVGSGVNLNQTFVNYNWNSTMTYINSWANHDLTAMIGSSMQRSENTNFNVSGNGFPSNDLRTLNSAASITSGGGSISTFAFLGFLSRVTYTYQDKYILTVNGRYDGSSRFGSDNRYGFFPAASAGWIISDESFLSNNDVLDFLKLRVSYGVTGNSDGIGNFPSLGLISVGDNYNEVPGFTPTQVANPTLKWERAQQLDIGIDYGFVNSRIRGTVGYFNKLTTDLLLNQPISRTNGYPSITKNIGEMQNSGLEFDITADILTGPLSWTSSFNISAITNEVKELVGGEDIVSGQQVVREGEALGSFFVQEFAGVNPDNGMALWYLNREPTADEEADGDAFKVDGMFDGQYVTDRYALAERILAGSPFPDFFGGFRNNFAYKGVDLGIFFQYSLGNELYRADGQFTDSNLNSLFNQSTRQLDYWKEPGDITNVPKPIWLSNNGGQSSTRYVEDASYLRLKTATLGYTLPTTLTKNYQIRLYVMGTNLLTVTSDEFHGMDPEVTSAPANNINQGNIFFAPSQARTIRFGIDFKL